MKLNGNFPKEIIKNRQLPRMPVWFRKRQRRADLRWQRRKKEREWRTCIFTYIIEKHCCLHPSGLCSLFQKQMRPRSNVVWKGIISYNKDQMEKANFSFSILKGEKGVGQRLWKYTYLSDTKTVWLLFCFHVFFYELPRWWPIVNYMVLFKKRFKTSPCM